jgi:glycosyltransferase involved in cell wall biosynthesis
MRVSFFVREVMPEGGVTLAAFRLATALVEVGREAEVLYCAGEPPAELASLGRRIEGQPAEPAAPRDLEQELRASEPDVVIVGSAELDDLRRARLVAPTLLHAHLHIGTCADTSRYWYRLQRPCGVKAGWKCAALRPVLGCSDLRSTLRPSAVAAQRRMLEFLRGGDVGVLCVSSDQAERYVSHGVPPARVTTVPNLGIRFGADRLAAAAAAVPAEWRDAIAFIGRISKTKGGELLPEIQRNLSPASRLRIWGEGYLAESLADLPPEALCGHVSQEMVAGILMWARALAFPSLWPEPGGIVGVDAQLMGVPLAAFDIGAGRHWPAAERFDRTDVAGMARWLDGRDHRREQRDPEQVARAQVAYWEQVATRTSRELADFAGDRAFRGSGEMPPELIIRDAQRKSTHRSPR